MNIILEIERLQLTPLLESDADIETAMGTDPDVMRYIGDVETADEIIHDMPKYIRRCAGGYIGIWCVNDRSTGEKIGTAILLPLPIKEDDTNWDSIVGDDLPDGEIEAGYMFKKSA